jgi:hypothetical protein
MKIKTMKLSRLSLAFSAVFLAAILIACTQSGCVPLIAKCHEGRYDGLKNRIEMASASNATVHVLMVHGMGDHCPGEWNDFVERMADQLRLKSRGLIKTNYLSSSIGVTNLLRQFHYGAGTTNFVFYELTWTPTTIRYKTNAFTKDRTLNPDRLWLNNTLKHDMMDEGVGDAMLYLNPTFRSNMQEPILQAIQIVTNAVTNEDDQIVLLTHSLGSVMIFDTIATHSDLPEVKTFADRTTDIFMLANQIPLLNLALSTNLQMTPSVSAQESPIQAFVRLSKSRKHVRLADRRLKRGSVSRETTTNLFTINIIAATDPNDLLSWPLGTNDIMSVPDQAADDDIKISLSNIYAHNAWGVPWLVENPETAHNNYQKKIG